MIYSTTTIFSAVTLFSVFAAAAPAAAPITNVNIQCKTGDGDASRQTSVDVGKGFVANSIDAVECFSVTAGVSCQAFLSNKVPVGDIFNSVTSGVFTDAAGAGETGGTADQAKQIAGFECATDPKKISTFGKAPTSTTSASSTASATATSSGAGATQTVKVGANGMLAFDPQEVVAKKGDTIIFDFFAKNHTLTQSEFATPCTPNGKFDTGFNQFNPDNIEGKFLKPFVVEDDSKPLWFFCAQPNPAPHCHKGMVFAINPTVKGVDKFGAFRAAALALDTVTPPPATKPTARIQFLTERPDTFRQDDVPVDGSIFLTKNSNLGQAAIEATFISSTGVLANHVSCALFADEAARRRVARHVTLRSGDVPTSHGIVKAIKCDAIQF